MAVVLLISKNLQPGSPIVESRRRVFFGVIQALLLLLHGSVLADTREPGVAGHTSRDFKQVVAALQQESPGSQTRFATNALAVLVEIHLAEADLARNEAHELDQKEKLLGWAEAVDQFADLLMLVMHDVTAGFPVNFLTGSPGPVTLTVAGRMVLLSPPRADQQQAYELRVLSEYCSRGVCANTVVKDEASDPISLSSPTQPPQWQFNEQGPVCFSDEDAIHVQFHSTDNLSLLRTHCEQLFFEIRSLQHEIRSRRAQGTALDWETMALFASPGEPEHRVQLNRSGDSLVLSLPLIYASPQLFELLRARLQAEGQSRAGEVLLIDSFQFGWEEGSR